jgi:hypothetical protein
MGIEKKSLSIVRLIVFPNRLGRTTRETIATQSMKSAIKSVLSIIVYPRFKISLKLSRPMGLPIPAKRVAVPSSIIEKRLVSMKKKKREINQGIVRIRVMIFCFFDEGDHGGSRKND